MPHPHVVICPTQGYLLNDKSFGHLLDDNIAIFKTPSQAEKIAETTQERVGKECRAVCYTSAVREHAKSEDKYERRRRKEIRTANFHSVPIHRVFVPKSDMNKADVETVQFLGENTPIDPTKPVFCQAYILKGTLNWGVILFQNGEVTTLESHEFEAFEEVYRIQERNVEPSDN